MLVKGVLNKLKPSDGGHRQRVTAGFELIQLMNEFSHVRTVEKRRDLA